MIKNFGMLIVLLWNTHSSLAANSINEKPLELDSLHQTSLCSTETIPNFQLQDGEKNFFPLKSKNPRYQGLFNLIYGYLDFCEDSLNNFRKAAYYDASRESPSVLNVLTAQSMVSKVNKIDNGTYDLEAFLQECLWGRLEYIQDRAQAHRQTKARHAAGLKLDSYLIPTSPKAIEFLKKKQDELGEAKSPDYRFALESISRYQFLNELILQLFQLIKPTELSKKTKEFISCSRTLWPILLGETTDLSYPDAAVLTYDEDPVNLRDRKDYNYFWSHYELQNYTMTMMNWCRQEQTFRLSRWTILEYEGYEYQKIHGRSEILPLPRPNWLYPETQKKIVLGQESTSSSTPKKLPRTKAKNQPPAKQVGKKKKIQPKRNVANPKVDLNNLNSPVESSDTEHVDSDQEGTILGDILEKQGTVEETYSTTPSTTLDSESSKMEGEQLRSETSKVLEPEVESVDSFFSDPREILLDELATNSSEESTSQNSKESTLPPRGLRAYHSENRVLEEQTLPSLSGKMERLIETIFDYRAHGQGFNFGQFRQLWESINGKDSARPSGSGSSHYALLNQKGQVVAGTFAHGDGQEYTKTTVRYLRAALDAIGIKDPHRKN